MSKPIAEILSITLKTSTIALILASTNTIAQNYPLNYEREYQSRDQEQNYQDYDEQVYRDKGYEVRVRRPKNRGEYYSQHYQPKHLPMPVEKVKSPVDLLEESINKVIYFLSRSQQASLDRISSFLKKEITPHFDFDYMSRWVAGRYYKTMTPEQQQQFTETFTGLFITTFVKKLTQFQNYPPVVGDFISKRSGKNEAATSVKIFQENGTNVKVDFKFLKTKSGWKVIDVRANGISALLYYRTYFSEQIRRREQHRAVFK